MLSPRTVSTRASPNTLRPATQIVKGPPAVSAGHSTNFAKLKRNAAFTRYSSGMSCPCRIVDDASTTARARRITSEPEGASDPEPALEFHAPRRGRAELRMVAMQQVVSDDPDVATRRDAPSEAEVHLGVRGYRG